MQLKLINQKDRRNVLNVKSWITLGSDGIGKVDVPSHDKC